MGSTSDQKGDAARAHRPHRRRWAAVGLAGTVLVGGAGCGPYHSHASSETTRSERNVRAALHTVWAALESADPGPVLATFTDDVQLHSPALIGPQYGGRDLVATIVTPAMQVLGSARVTDVLAAGDGTTGSIVFETRIGDEPAQGVVLLRTRAEQVSEITLVLRPLPALRAFVDRMGELGAKPALDAGDA